MSLIRANNLSVGYETGAVAKGISFTLEDGDYLCIIGENGAGKSTLMKTLLRLQKPLGGELIFDEALQGGSIGYLPQQTLVQKDFPASVYEIVLSGCQGRRGIRPFYSRNDHELAESNLSKMGITNLRKRCYRELSGGQQQRVLLARALCAASRVILLDEPAAGLDPAAAEDMYEAVAALNREGMSVIMISHDMNAAYTRASHILMLGQKHFFGRAEAFTGDFRSYASTGKEGRHNA